MPRPRIYVNRHGRPVKSVTGVHFNRGRNRFYIILNGGRRPEFKTWGDARAAYLSAHEEKQVKYLAPVQMPLRDPRFDIPKVRLPSLPPPVLTAPGTLAANDAGKQLTTCQFVDESLAVEWFRQRLAADPKALAATVGVPALARIDSNPKLAKGGPRLADVIKKWEQHKVEDAGGHVTSYILDVKRHWKQFVAQAKDTRVAELDSAHFRGFHSWLALEGAKYSSAQWRLDRAKHVKSVIKYVRKKYPEWPWPAGVVDWADSFESRAVRPKARNRAPMPANVVDALIGRCRAWAGTDPEAVDATTQSGRGKRVQARRKRRNGVQFEAILRLALNCALDPIDVERITWEDLKLDAATPYISFARRKVESKIGAAVERITPLLPSTLEALRRWQAYEGGRGGPVFRTASKAKYGRNIVSGTINRLREEAGVGNDWSFKHLRNVGPTLARRARLSRDEREAFLGHVVDGTSRFYEGDVNQTYLIPLVNLIGMQYCGGERVAMSGSAEEDRSGNEE